MAKGKKSYKVKGSLLYTALPKVWRTLQKENKIEGIYKRKAKLISIMCYFVVRPLTFLQQLLFNKKVKTIDISNQQPIFILGHWRSGTTHLHYLFHQDPKYGTLSNYQCFMVNLALLSKSGLKSILAPLMPKTRPQDNVVVDPDLPAEEEQPLCTMTHRSGFHSWTFPKNRSYFNTYNLFQNISSKEKEGWQKDYHFLLQHITYYNNGKQLVLKNPHNTSRVKELLELYPKAKFVFIHRNPYDVFVSTRHLMYRMIRAQFMQFMSHKEIDNMIFYYFEKTMKKYLSERDLIPKQNLIEVSFDDLEKDSAKEIEKIYTSLNLPGFDKAKENINTYLASVKNYKKNKFRDLKPLVLERINKEWGFAFDAWNYSIEK